MDTDLIWFYARTHDLRATDLMQGPMYGLSTNESDADKRLAPFFNYDDIFGTSLNRFLVQAAAGVPLTVYGKGGQTRGYLNIKDTISCIRLAAENPIPAGELRILNQFVETFRVNDLARRVAEVGRGMGLDVTVNNIPNPRKEAEDHYYNPAHSGLLKLGLEPHYLTDDLLAEMLQRVLAYKDRIVQRRIMPRVSWS